MILYTDTLFPKVKLITGHEFAQVYTDGERFFCIIPLFRKAEVGMLIRDFTKQVGIPNKLHSDRSTEQMGQKSDFQCAIQELFIQWRTLKPCSDKILPQYVRQEDTKDTNILLLEEKANSCQCDSKCWSMTGACTCIMINDGVTSTMNAFDGDNTMLGRIIFL